MPGVLQHAVPGEGARAFRIAGGGGEDRLLDDGRGATIASHAVDHADERRDCDRQRAAHQHERRAAQPREQRQRDQRAAPAQPIAAERDGQ
jgi:hypothetical protein